MKKWNYFLKTKALRIILATSCLILVFASSVIAAERPAYIKAATYFSDEWAANFWNSESIHMDEELAGIANDGFNCIILVVPWREFQPYMNSSGFCEYTFQKLDQVMECAKSHGLGVMLRVGYTWDYANSASVLDRYQALLTSESTREAWKKYAGKVYQAAAAHGNLYGGFLTWEDFWNYIDIAGSAGHGVNSVSNAKAIGYQSYLKETYSLEQINTIYDHNFLSFDEIYLPLKSEPQFRLFYEFYDHFLNQLLIETQTVFPDLSMEVRLDEDAGIGHTSTFGCGNSTFVSAMYNVSMGEGHNVILSPNQAVSSTAAAFSRTRNLAGGKPLFVDQFLYMDNTLGFEKNARISDGEVPAYLTSMSLVLQSQTMGYGVWTYRNYCDNIIFNSQFALGNNGWKFTGGASVADDSGNKKAKFLADGGRATQVIGNRNSGHAGREISVRFKAKSDEKQTITVSLGGTIKSVTVNGEQSFKLNFGKVNFSEISFNGKSCWIDDVCVYSHIQDGQLHGVDGEPLSCLTAMRNLNASVN